MSLFSSLSSHRLGLIGARSALARESFGIQRRGGRAARSFNVSSVLESSACGHPSRTADLLFLVCFGCLHLYFPVLWKSLRAAHVARRGSRTKSTLLARGIAIAFFLFFSLFFVLCVLREMKRNAIIGGANSHRTSPYFTRRSPTLSTNALCIAWPGFAPPCV